jgi:hypothetical protein
MASMLIASKGVDIRSVYVKQMGEVDVEDDGEDAGADMYELSGW